MTHISTSRGRWLAVALGLAIFLVTEPALAQCPNNCTGHGTCVPSQKNKRFECECYDGWVGNACSQKETASAKAKREEQVIVDMPEEADIEADSDRRGKPMTGVREFWEVAESSWSDLQPREEALLKSLGWKRDAWNNRNTGRAQWPPAMYKPFNALKKSEQSAASGLGFTAQEWNTGQHVTLLTQHDP